MVLNAVVEQVIVEVLGTPTERDMRFVQRKSAKDAIDRMGAREKVPFTRLFPRANPLAVDLLEKMLVFDPEKRITATVSFSEFLFSPVVMLRQRLANVLLAVTAFIMSLILCIFAFYHNAFKHLRSAFSCLPVAHGACVPL